jgi:hypothetical protein
MLSEEKNSRQHPLRTRNPAQAQKNLAQPEKTSYFCSPFNVADAKT